MKRRNFIKGVGLGAAALATAGTAKAFTTSKTMEEFVHNPADWVLVPEEPEEFQEYEVDVPEDWAEEDIIWV